MVSRIIIIFITCIIFLVNYSEQQIEEEECCHVEKSELERFQHIRELSHKFLIILGVQKSGTTVMFDIISAHPQTRRAITRQGHEATTGGQLKELHFFDTKNLKFENYVKSFNLSALEEGKTMFEGTPEYLQYAGGACLIKYYQTQIILSLSMNFSRKRSSLLC